MRSSGPISPVDRVCERSLSTSSVTSSTATLELDKLELGERGFLNPVYSRLIEKWFSLGLGYPCSSLPSGSHVPSIKLHTATLLAPLTIPLLLKAFTSTVTDTSIKIFSSVGDGVYYPFLSSSLCRKQTSPEKQILGTRYILIGRNFSQWKETLSGEINLLENSQLALKMQRNYQRFVSFVHDHTSSADSRYHCGENDKNSEHLVSPLIPRQRLLWVTVSDKQWMMYM